MQLEVGLILEGKITGVTNFGAFVELPEGKTGMVHISEVASDFVKEIKDYVKVGQVVKVKVLGLTDGKISLSMKKAIEVEQPKKTFRNTNKLSQNKSSSWQSSTSDNENSSFEDMMSRFKKASDEKMSDLKKTTEAKRGGFSRRGNGNSR